VEAEVGADEVGAEVVGSVEVVVVVGDVGVGDVVSVGALDVGAEVGAEESGAPVGPEVCTTGDGWCPRAGVTGLGETTRWPAGASRTAASATAPPTAARPATVTVAGCVPKRRNSVRRRSARSAGRLARWAPRLLRGADTNAAVGQTRRAAVT
jgi:hypothetical protein